MNGEIKIRTGSGEPFLWTAPTPAEVAPAPRLECRGAGLVHGADLVPVRAPVMVTDVGDDLVTLTLDAPVIAGDDGLQGDELGLAWLMPTGGQPVQVEILRLDGDQLTLARPLPHDVATPAEVRWATHTAPLGQALAQARRDLVWTVTYTERAGADAPARVAQDRGRLIVADQPFATGLTHARLISALPSLSSRVAAGDVDHSAAIHVATTELGLALRADLQVKGLTEDDADGRVFQLAHAYMTAAVIYDLDEDGERAERLRTRARDLYNQALAGHVWLDHDQDGQVDAGEVTPVDHRGGFVGSNMATLRAAASKRARIAWR